MLEEEEMSSVNILSAETNCRTGEEARSVACYKSYYQRCWRTFIVICQASKSSMGDNML